MAEFRGGYESRFRKMHEDATDHSGEARLIDALLNRGATVLDAGSGMGRLTAELNLRGHYCIGVDKDRQLVNASRELHGPGHDFIEADLAELDSQRLASAGWPASYDLIAAIGNVLVYLAPGSEAQVLRNFAALLSKGGRLVTGFATDREYSLAQFDDDAAAAGFTIAHRFATWQLDAFESDSDWATTVLVKTT